MPNKRPVVLVHGILGFGPKELGPLNYWGTAFKVPSPIPRFEASVGPLSSAHDRACELAAQIKGTCVDYGAAHAKREGHARFGADYTGKGFVPDWSAVKPVHLVGHSLGSPTTRCLQHLLAIDYWGWGSDAGWVASLTTLSGVSNGSTLTYFFGADERTGLLGRVDLAAGLLLIVEAYAYATGGIQDAVYNFDLDHWGFERRPGESLAEFLLRLSDSRFLAGRDNACYSLTLQGAYGDNAAWKTYRGTYYFSHITVQTEESWLSGRHYPSPRMNPALLPHATYIGRKQFDRRPIPVKGFQAADWWENDGAVSTHSQMYPHVSGKHPVGIEFDAKTPASRLGKGRWHYSWVRDVDHLDICVLPQADQIGWQRRFYIGLFERLASLKLD
jgi:triacylglycerol esterase/lipase EstA (alpha/beta hydrolase family)